MTNANNSIDGDIGSMSAEELAVRVGDIDDFRLTRPVLRDRIEEITQENLVWRQVFRDYPAQDINSNVVQFPVPNDDIGNPDIVDEGAEFPREQETYSKETLTFNKFGFEVVVTHEAEEDSMVDVVRDQVDRQARQMSEEMNLQAYDVISGNNRGTVGDNDGVFTYADVLAGRQALMQDNYDPDLLIGDIDAAHDLLQDGNFLEATEEQSNMRRSGMIGEIAGFDVVQDDSGVNITGNGNPGAIMVDTDFYGYEGEREPVSTEEYREDRNQADVYQVYTRMGWLAIDPQSCVVIEG
jgi:hypothetical protein